MALGYEPASVSYLGICVPAGRLYDGRQCAVRNTGLHGPLRSCGRPRFDELILPERSVGVPPGQFPLCPLHQHAHHAHQHALSLGKEDCRNQAQPASADLAICRCRPFCILLFCSDTALTYLRPNVLGPLMTAVTWRQS